MLVPLLPTAPAPAALAPMITRRQYIGLTFLTGCILAVLGLPAQLSRPDVTAGQVALRFGQILLFTDALMALNYWLRFSDTRLRRWLRRRPAWQHRTLRIVLNLLLALLVGPLLARGLGEGTDPTTWTLLLASSAVFAVVILIVQMFIEISDRSQRLVGENERLQREQLQARYDSLKQQLSPHFLFDSLSTLRWLVHEDPAAAERFTEEMAAVYRYLLHHGEQAAVPLAEELRFLDSYVYLLQMRFGESLQLDVDLPAPLLTRQIPPLALQTLVENAVKHNAVTRKQPLRIRIGQGPDECLLVRNSRQPRLTPAPSSGVGLRNLASRVRLLHQAELLVEQDEQEFRVCVPLLAG